MISYFVVLLPVSEPVCLRVQYISCVEHIARAAGVTVTDEGLNIEEATQLIVDRVEQLYDINSQDKQSLIHTLQLKLKSLKERLQLKVIINNFIFQTFPISLNCFL